MIITFQIMIILMFLVGLSGASNSVKDKESRQMFFGILLASIISFFASVMWL